MRGQTACARDGAPDLKLVTGMRLRALGGDVDLDDIPPAHIEHFVHAGDEEPWRVELIDRRNAEYRERGHA